jgi:WD40 repeat protein
MSPITGNWLASLGESEIKIGGVDPTVDKTSSLYSLKDGANHFLTSVISSDNSLLFSGTREGWINEWNLQSPTLDSDRPFRFTSPKPLAIKNVGSLAVSRDGTFLVAAGEEVNQRKSWLGLWDIRKKKWLKPISSPHQSTIVGLHFLLDLKVIISVGSQGKAYIWNLDLSGQKSIRKLEIKSRAGIKDSTVICSALSSNGKYLVLGFKSGEIAVWNLKDIK